MPQPVLPSHQIVDHVSEIALDVRAGSLADLVAEAGRALAAVQLVGADRTPSGPPRLIEVTAPDREALLVEWLNELIFLAEVERWVALDFTVDRAEEHRVVAHAWGATLEHAPSLVKAATLHQARIADLPGGLEARVLLDV